MIPRYERSEISEVWSDENKLNLWQETELAVLEARALLIKLSQSEYLDIKDVLQKNPVDTTWWKKKEKETRHDLDAWLDERRRFLPSDIRYHFHEEMTSYDTEEPAFARMLKESIKVVERFYCEIETVLTDMALRYRYTIMMARTHGQEAELQTFGKRCLAWCRDLQLDRANLEKARDNLRYSKLSGAIGNYGGMDPALEKKALEILGFEPFYGATQILPRELYAPLAQALCQIVMTLDKIATTIRLGARSGNPIYQEPFGKSQKGSSRMPHKKNTISSEQMEGMARMAQGYQNMIMANIKTWEERAIEQSCVERVAWPDLFHVAVHCLETMTRVIKGLAVYQDNMLLEIVNSRGCYAAGGVKSFLAEKGASLGLSADDAYKIVQLAAFNVFSPGAEAELMRKNLPISFKEAEETLERFQKLERLTPISIKEVIGRGELKTSSELAATEEDVQEWNEVLGIIFRNPANREEFDRIFSVSYLLRHEEKLYKEILGI